MSIVTSKYFSFFCKKKPLVLFQPKAFFLILFLRKLFFRIPFHIRKRNEYAWIRLAGKAVFEENMAVKEACMENPTVKGQYGEATNPIFKVFYLENAHGVIADFSGNPPYKF